MYMLNNGLGNMLRAWAKNKLPQLFGYGGVKSAPANQATQAEFGVFLGDWGTMRQTTQPRITASSRGATVRRKAILSAAEHVWGNGPDATAWLNSPHPELHGETPLPLLRTEPENA